MVNEGRRPGLTLRRGEQEVGLQQWAGELLERIGLVAAQLDQSQGGEAHAQALAEQQAKVADSRLTPSAQVLQAMRDTGESFTRFAMRQTLRHAEYFRSRPLPDGALARFEQAARESLQQQAAIEAADSQDFDSFVEQYQRSLG